MCVFIITKQLIHSNHSKEYSFFKLTNEVTKLHKIPKNISFSILNFHLLPVLLKSFHLVEKAFR